MTREGKQHRRNELEARVKRLQQRAEHLSELDNRLSNIRLLLFGGGLALSFLSYLYTPDLIFLAVVFISVALFIWVAKRHQRVADVQRAVELWKAMEADQLARCQLDWDNVSYRPVPVDPDYVDDINLFGRRSVFQLLDQTVSQGGQNRLLEWILATEADPELLTDRMENVKALADRNYFRQRIRLSANIARQDGDLLSARQLVQWTQTEDRQSEVSTYLALLAGLALVNMVLIALNFTGLIGPWWLASLFIYFTILYQQSGLTASLFDKADEVADSLSALSGILSWLEQYRVPQDDPLHSLLKPIQQPKSRPSIFISSVQRISAWAAISQKNPFFGFLLNLAVPWDFFFTFRLNRLRERLSEELEQWLDALYELEALSSLANLNYLNPHYTFARFWKREECHSLFEGQELGHPLIPEQEQVRNSFTIRQPGDIALITGSNMSGKSTFLRTVAITIKLAQTGAPVDAQSVNLTPLQLFTCINISDSLNEGISYFYAEVKRLRKLLDLVKADAQQPVCYFVDEIFRGTNNRERLIGSRSLIRELAQHPSVGFISTHDLELVALEDEIDQLSNYHFKEEVADGRMIFDYTLREGPSPTTNALKIMEQEGLPVDRDE